MAAEVVYSSTNGADVLQGQLFDGMKFWLSAKVPQRSRFINDLKANGAEVVLLERNADVRIVDHARKEALPGTHSYIFIERSVRNGALEDLANHAVGPAPGAIRSVASTSHPAKITRQKYTQEDEKILWDWVNANPQTGGGTDGNEIYKQLEMKHPQHPWQSWRDHYRKSMKGRAVPIYPPNNGPPTPPLETPVINPGLAQRAPARFEARNYEFDGFSEEDEEALMESGQDILNISEENLAAAWTRWANEGDMGKKHNADEWQAFWERRVRPRFLRRKAMREKSAVDTKERSSKPPRTEMQPKTQTLSTSKARDDAQASQRAPSPHERPPKSRSIGSPLSPVVQTKNPMLKPELTDEAPSPLGNSILKRKRPVIEEVPSNSPPSTHSPPVARRMARKKKEIASTPDQSPRRQGEDRFQPLFLGEMLRAEAEDDFDIAQDGASSPLGQQPSESLSEPDRTVRASTQALFRATTPHIDFEIPLPEGGWGGDEETDLVDGSESRSEYGSARDQSPAPDTQAILHGTTQVPDLSIPDPDDPWNSLIPPSSPPLLMPSSPGAASESSSAQQAHIDEKIDNLLKDRMEQGFSAEQIIAVLNSTCTNLPLSEQVLQQMGPQNGNFTLPDNMRGVWTAEDDQHLHSFDAREVGNLEPKHGADNVNARYEWLEMMTSEEREQSP